MNKLIPPCKFEVRVELRTVDATGVMVYAFGTIPVETDIQQHIEMAGRAAAVQAYFDLLRKYEGVLNASL